MKGLHRKARAVTMCMAYITAAEEDEKRARSGVGCILRAGQICFKRYNSQPSSVGYRALNGIKVHEVQGIEEQRVNVAVGRRKMWGFLIIPVIVADSVT